MSKVPLYQAFSSALGAYKNCLFSGKKEWEKKHLAKLKKLCKEHMPSGSGIDTGVEFDEVNSHSEKLIFQSGYHPMDEWGGYIDWLLFELTVTPSLQFDFNLEFNLMEGDEEVWQEHEDYLYQLFEIHLASEVNR